MAKTSELNKRIAEVLGAMRQAEPKGFYDEALNDFISGCFPVDAVLEMIKRDINDIFLDTDDEQAKTLWGDYLAYVSE